METTDFEEHCAEIARLDRLRYGPPQPDSARQRIGAMVDRIAVAVATNNGDPILAETRILSETTRNLAPKTEEELDADGSVAVDASGGRYSTYVRSDGRGQIDIRWPGGLEKTLKFWVPDAYLPASVGAVIEGGRQGFSLAQTNTMPLMDSMEVHRSSSAGPEARVLPGTDFYQATARLLSRHPLVFILVGIAFAIDLYRFFWLDALDGPYALGSFIAVVYFLGCAYAMRFVIARRRLHLAVALVLSLALYFGWACLSALILDGRIHVSWLLAACLIAAFKTMRFDANEA